jgi:hypothetical protein
MTYDFQYGAGAASPQFTMNGGSTPIYGYNSLDTYGMGSPTLGSAIPDAGGTLGTTSSLAGAAPAANGGLFGIQGLGANLPTFQLGLQGLTTGANLLAGLKALGLAQDQFNFNKNLANKNLANSVASYNTALTDRATARAVTEGQSAAQRDAYINANKLSA